MPAWGFKAIVPKATFVRPTPVITKFSPGHDYRLVSDARSGSSAHVEIIFSQEMDCDSVTKAIQIRSSTEDGQVPQLVKSTIQCLTQRGIDPARWVGAPDGVWAYAVDLRDVSHGIHEITIANATSQDKKRFTNVGDATFPPPSSPHQACGAC